MTSNSYFKVMPLLDTEYPRNSKRYGHSYNETLIGTFSRPIQECHFEQNIQWQEALHSFPATSELLVLNTTPSKLRNVENINRKSGKSSVQSLSIVTVVTKAAVTRLVFTWANLQWITIWVCCCFTCILCK